MLGIERRPVSISQKGNDFHVQIGDDFDYSAYFSTENYWHGTTARKKTI